MYQYLKGEDLLSICLEKKCSIVDVVVNAEMEESGMKKDELFALMNQRLLIMEESIQKGLSPDLKSVGGLIGGNAIRLLHTKDDSLCGGITIKAASYALAVSEFNAAMGKIVAAPTAGASGIVPGVIIAVKEDRGLTKEKAVEGLMVSSAIGRIIAINATLSGAEGGCQAECGSAAAMAAAAVVYMCNGSPEMSLNAAALALKGLLGLVCDPVAGLVEVPCSKRNASCAAFALICADMTMAGIKSFIPFDETVEAMYRVGRSLSPHLRETAQGGCAITPTALEYTKKFKNNL